MEGLDISVLDISVTERLDKSVMDVGILKIFKIV